MSLYVGGKKYNITMAKWRGFWSVTIHGFPGTIIDCGTQKTVGEDRRVIFKFAEAGTYTFIAMRGTETKVFELELVEGEYFIDKSMFIGIGFLQYVNTNSGAMASTGIIPATNDFTIRMKYRVIKPVTTVSGIWGYMQSPPDIPRFGLYLNSGTYGTGLNNTVGLGFIYDDQIVEFEYKDYQFKFDGFSRYTIGPSETKNTTIPIYFGARGNQNGQAQWPIDMDIYEFDIIYGKITKTYRPCQEEDGTVGFWDTTNNEFISSITDVPFIAGPEVG